MLYGELKFFHGNTVIRTIYDDEFSEFNPEQLKDFVQSIVVATLGLD